MLKNFLAYILKLFARAMLWRYRPRIIGVTGSVGKTSTKEAIFAVLSQKFNVRRNYKNYNNEIGVPLSIIGAGPGGHAIFGWLKVFIIGISRLIYCKSYPEILVLEMGADRIGDISYLASFIACDIGVISAIGEIPAHLEFFRTAEQVTREKAALIKSLRPQAFAILNFDDERVCAAANSTKANILSFGFSKAVNLRASDLAQQIEDLDNAELSFEIAYQGNSKIIKLPGVLGAHQAYPVLAAVACGLIFKMNLIEISQALKNYQPPPGRLGLIKGIKNSWILDDTYNSSPSSALAALDVLAKINGRRIAVLGDMLELGFFTEEAHRRVGAKAAGSVDLLLAVGERSIFISDEAKKSGLAEERVFHFADSYEAGRKLQDLICEGDVVLIKGSQGIRMERVVKEIMAEPERAAELLVRQEEKWQNR